MQSNLILGLFLYKSNSFEIYSLYAGKSFMTFLSSADFYSKLHFSKISFMTTRVLTNSLDPDQARRYVRPDLGKNCLRR